MNGYEEWRTNVDWSYQHVFTARLSWSLPKLLFEGDEESSLVCSLLRTSAFATWQRTILGFPPFLIWQSSVSHTVLIFLYKQCMFMGLDDKPNLLNYCLHHESVDRRI